MKYHRVNQVSFVSKDRRVMLGYWQRPDADEIIKNGWLHRRHRGDG